MYSYPYNRHGGALLNINYILNCHDAFLNSQVIAQPAGIIIGRYYEQLTFVLNKIQGL